MPQEEEYTSDSGSDFTEYWIDWFLGTKGNEYFCDIDFEYITDRFNLTGLSTEVNRISAAIDIITDNAKIEGQPAEVKEQLEYNARFLYGLVHARYIITQRGLAKMLEKYRNGDFGYCPRVYCKLQPLLPVGLNDSPRLQPVKLYCPRCEDLYNPKSSRHAAIDGAFFGSSFPAMFFQAYPHLVPTHPTERYVPKVFGFQLHEYAKLARWQAVQRQKTEARLYELGVPVDNCPGGYVDPQEGEEEPVKSAQ
ncbi:hypothetical protein BABINDRAFT_162877 [Babjeviella inositovora NRRL Y-12698]|uniref:Casein kinase II subunit beta n=1 Tax=Babjeviella inositovora NRRL Y-12698 TaxID=984486 RepID=A0A1E3QKK2_9ASCO|nr:uncharacterized protein BABINDRAFT_162877 [Babjeviella inositovora NRRL Y-12698]ODQ78213.1 hypothetical protein BABINDRAFT_162877 [Babjeviella inositovora NRRL Y-12698]